MNDNDLRNRVMLIYAVRVRKELYRQRYHDPKELQIAIRNLLASRFWKHLGFNSLYDYLTNELGMPYDPASDLVVEAVNMKLEDRAIYESTGNTVNPTVAPEPIPAPIKSTATSGTGAGQ